jgi:hypothetical protein
LSWGIQPRIFNSNGCIVVRTRGDTKYTELLYIHYADAQITTLISYPNSTDTFIQNSPSNHAIFTKEQNQNYITLLWDDGYIHEALPPHIESLDGYMLQEHIAMLLTPQGPWIWNITTWKFIPVFEFDSFWVGNTDIIGFVSGTTELQSFLYPNRKNILVKKSLFRGTRSVLGEWTYKDLPLKIIVSAHDTIAIETNNSFYSVE